MPMRLLGFAVCVVVLVPDASLALPAGHESLTYSVDGITSGAFARFPNVTGTPKGVLLLWHGTVLPPNFGTVENEYSNSVGAWQVTDFDDLIVVMPHQIGLGATWNSQKQKWQQLKGIQSDGNALLVHVYDKAKTKYSFADGTVLRLFMWGQSQGGTSSLAYHYYYQAAPNIMKLYDLKVTVASAGHYSADVWESSFKPYSSYESDANMLGSYSSDLLPVSKKMQNVLLCHLLHTYRSSQEPHYQDIEYEAAYGYDEASAGDDWSQMFKMINLVMPDQGAVTSSPVQSISGYDSKPAFLTAASWAKLTDANSDLRKALRNYLVQNSVVEAFSSIFDANLRDVSVFYACNDLNVPCKHGKMLPTGHRVTHHDVTPAGDAITSLFDRHALAQTQSWDHLVAKVKLAKEEVAAAPSVTGQCGSTDADLAKICNVPGGVCHSFCVKSDPASTICDYRGSYIKNMVSFHDGATAAHAAGGDVSATKIYRLAPPAFADLPDNCNGPDFYAAVDNAAGKFLGSSKHVSFELYQTCSLATGSSACDPFLPAALVAESATSTAGKSVMTGQALGFDENSVTHQMQYRGLRGADQVLTYQLFARDALLEKVTFGGTSQPKVCLQPNCKAKAVKAGQFKFSVGTIFGQGLAGVTSIRLDFKIALENGDAGTGDIMTEPTATADPYRFQFQVGATTFSIDFAKEFLYGVYTDTRGDFNNPSTGQASLSFTAASSGIGATIHVDMTIDSGYQAVCGSAKCMMLYDPDVTIVTTASEPQVGTAGTSKSRLMGATCWALLLAVYMGLLR